ncbi:hypothetical protein [Amycolatopsis sp. H20-H5]|uniref:hypothetical protein n=1 Tax=Amycolatopsis sp. H20-H5 TaxID=3046309 RepID=UPI002DB9C1B9|nr:hypothetical protein [Amycolatopsis sp. H20-H5]MEC3974912.1 hypothetical protein [Amycolatopsis sp. H20-H5]
MRKVGTYTDALVMGMSGRYRPPFAFAARTTTGFGDDEPAREIRHQNGPVSGLRVIDVVLRCPDDE